MDGGMRVLMIGDIVGKPGLRMVELAVPWLRKTRGLDFVVANAENVVDGSGLSPAGFRRLMACGVDCVTLGDHIYRRNEIAGVLKSDHRLVKPANYPATAPGRAWTVVASAKGEMLAVVSVLGRVFMKPVDCPFQALDRVLGEIPPEVRFRLLDIHAEATSDKQLLARFVDGRFSAAVGTHTHVPTADEQILPGGTAFQCDVGMTGPHESILGRRIDRVLETTLTFQPTMFEVATGDVRLHGSLVEIGEDGKATAISRVAVRQEEVPGGKDDGRREDPPLM